MRQRSQPPNVGENVSKNEQAENEQLVVAAAVKRKVQATGMRFGGDVPEALNQKVQELVDAAMKRAKANQRETVTAKDF